MAAVSLFWDTNMAAVTSCENTLYEMQDRDATINIVDDKTNRADYLNEVGVIPSQPRFRLCLDKHRLNYV